MSFGFKRCVYSSRKSLKFHTLCFCKRKKENKILLARFRLLQYCLEMAFFHLEVLQVGCLAKNITYVIHRKPMLRGLLQVGNQTSHFSHKLSYALYWGYVYNGYC